MRREIYIFIGLVAVFSFALVLPAEAGTLEQVIVTPSTSLGGISGNYTIDFVVASSTEIEAQIRLIFPAGFDVTGATATSTVPSTTTGAIIASSTVSGQEITLWLADGAVGTASTSMQVQADVIQSPYAGGSFTLGVETRTLADGLSDSASSTAFTINANLTLEQVTVTPTTSYGGIVGNYKVAFIVASSTEIQSQIRLIFPAGFNVAGATATSSISASSGGASVVATSTVSGQEITLWLADGSVTTASDTIEVSGITNIQSPYAGGNFTLGIETRTLADELSNSASSTAFAIISSPNTASSKDTSPPISKITNPTSSLSIPAGKEYVIIGTGTDADGSIVKNVEVSIDGGQTWFPAQTYAVGGTYNWEYVWQNPVAGEYTIKVRSTDSANNVESPSAGVDITVTGPAGAEVSTETPTEVTPTTETTTVQVLQNQVVALQQTLLGLLLQLIQILQARL